MTEAFFKLIVMEELKLYKLTSRTKEISILTQQYVMNCLFVGSACYEVLICWAFK